MCVGSMCVRPTSPTCVLDLHCYTFSPSHLDLLPLTQIEVVLYSSSYLFIYLYCFIYIYIYILLFYYIDILRYLYLTFLDHVINF